MARLRLVQCLSNSCAVSIYLLLYVVPMATEAWIVGRSGTGSLTAIITITVCATIQCLLALVVGVRLFYQVFRHQGMCCHDVLWCPSLLDLRTLISGPYILYILPLWIATNVICSWVNADRLPIISHLLCYLPVPLFGLGAGVGYAIARSCEVDDETEPLNV